MGSNPYAIVVEEDLLCPVCKKTLSTPGVPPKYKASKSKRGKSRPPHLLSLIQNSKDTKIALGKCRDNEDIVVAECGHLFHKFCLRHYCYLYREGQTNHMCRVTCPLCQRNISMMSSNNIHYKAHQDRITDREREYTNTSLMHSELSGQFEHAHKRLVRLSEQVEDGDQNLEIFRSHLRKVKNEIKQSTSEQERVHHLRIELNHTDKMLAFMQTQHLKIVRKFIIKVKQKPSSQYIHFPRKLSPFLKQIEGDDRLVRDLGEIIVPIHFNHLKSDRRSLLQGILLAVNDKMNGTVNDVAESNTKVVHTKDSHKGKKAIYLTAPKKKSNHKMPYAPVIVKVKRSSVSILSSTILSRESLQQIVDNVKNLPKSKQKGTLMQKAEKRELINISEKSSSASDIQVLFMPQRKTLHLQQYSEPCRSIDENESIVAKVPKRRCKSTDAILVKVKKKDRKETIVKGKQNLTLRRKRSSSIAHISTSKEKIEKRQVLILSPKSKGNANAPTLDETPAESQVEESKKEESSDINNNIIVESIPINHKKVESLQPEMPPEIAVARYEVKGLSTSVRPRQSLLEMIYDDLEEEKNFHMSSNQFECSINVENAVKLHESGQQLQAPKFFRIDGMGILRPENPLDDCFRQPTFLSPSKSATNQTPDLLDEPDIENQLSQLSPEERVLIAAEKDTQFQYRNNYGSIGKRAVFHGIPACLGMPNDSIYCAWKDSQNTPFYLKKWQQQLTSGREPKPTPRYRISNSKLSKTGQAIGNVQAMSKSQNICQQRPSAHRIGNEVIGSLLPPLSMLPIKRPSTSDCAMMTENDEKCCAKIEKRRLPHLPPLKGYFT